MSSHIDYEAESMSVSMKPTAPGQEPPMRTSPPPPRERRSSCPALPPAPLFSQDSPDINLASFGKISPLEKKRPSEGSVDLSSPREPLEKTLVMLSQGKSIGMSLHHSLRQAPSQGEGSHWIFTGPESEEKANTVYNFTITPGAYTDVRPRSEREQQHQQGDTGHTEDEQGWRDRGKNNARLAEERDPASNNSRAVNGDTTEDNTPRKRTWYMLASLFSRTYSALCLICRLIFSFPNLCLAVGICIISLVVASLSLSSILFLFTGTTATTPACERIPSWENGLPLEFRYPIPQAESNVNPSALQSAWDIFFQYESEFSLDFEPAVKVTRDQAKRFKGFNGHFIGNMEASGIAQHRAITHLLTSIDHALKQHELYNQGKWWWSFWTKGRNLRWIADRHLKELVTIADSIQVARESELVEITHFLTSVQESDTHRSLCARGTFETIVKSDPVALKDFTVSSHLICHSLRRMIIRWGEVETEIERLLTLIGQFKKQHPDFLRAQDTPEVVELFTRGWAQDLLHGLEALATFSQPSTHRTLKGVH